MNEPTYQDLTELVVWLSGALDVLPEDHPTRIVKEKIAGVVARMAAAKLKNNESTHMRRAADAYLAAKQQLFVSKYGGPRQLSLLAENGT